MADEAYTVYRLGKIGKKGCSYIFVQLLVQCLGLWDPGSYFAFRNLFLPASQRPVWGIVLGLLGIKTAVAGQTYVWDFTTKRKLGNTYVVVFVSLLNTIQR